MNITNNFGIGAIVGVDQKLLLYLITAVWETDSSAGNLL